MGPGGEPHVMATQAARTTLVLAPSQGSPWEEAIQLLHLDAAEEIRLKNDEKLDTLAEVLAAANGKRDQMKDKEWRYTRSNGTTVVFRDIFERIASRLNKLKDIGDTLTQVDPAHAGIPWGVIKFFLQAAIADTEKMGIIYDGIEMIVRMIGKFTVFEQIYLQHQMRATNLLRTALVRLYASILTFLAEAKRYYTERTGMRMLKSTFHIELPKVTKLKQRIQDEQVAVLEIARLIDAENLRDLNNDIQNMPSNMESMRKAIELLEAPMENVNTQLEGIVNRLERMKISELLGWISNIPYVLHHETARKGRLENSGIWLFDQSHYMSWRMNQSSALLWLHGMPGSGKSKLVSLVVNTLRSNQLNAQTEAVAYFYCTQNTSEPQRAEPDSILRSILRQLTTEISNSSIREPTIKKYQELQEHGFDLRQLTIEEVKVLLQQLLINTPTTIIIDALDECNPKLRFELISTFAQLLEAKNCLVKILISSRNSRLPNRLATTSTFTIDASQSTDDIDRFVDVEVRKSIQDERLLDGHVSKELEDRIVTTLKNGAQGMFLWVSLQIQNLCDPERFKLEEDVLEELGRLPQELSDVYSQICNKVMGQHTGRFARKVAETALRWLLCAQRSLSTDDFITAVYYSATEGKTENLISSSKFLEICGNMVVADKELDVFRFFHSSVREFLQVRPDFTPTLNHLTAAEICVGTLLTKEWIASEKQWQSASLTQYVTLFWAVHIENSGKDQIQHGNVGLILTQLSAIDGAPRWFVRWLLQIESASAGLLWNDPLKSKIENALCDAPVTALFMACAFGLTNTVDILTQNSTDILRRQNARKATCLHIACQFGYTSIVKLLVERGANVNRKNLNGGSSLILASIHGHSDIVEILLECGADPSIEHSEYGTALQAASLRGHTSVVQSLVRKVNIDSETGQFGTALQAASFRGHAEIIQILLNHGADVNALGGQYKVTPQLVTDDSTETALMIREFRFLLEQDQADDHCQQFVSENMRFETFVKLLLDRNIDINIQHEGLGTALHAACRGGHTEIVKILLDAGADVDIEQGAYGTAMQAAAVSGNLEVITLLVAKGASVNTETGIYNTALQAACRYSHTAIVDLLLENGAYVNAQGGVYGSALQAAVRAGDVSLANKLLDEGAYVDAYSGKYGTALQAACFDGSLELVDALLDHNADINMEGGLFGSALQSACANGHLKITQMLVRKGAKFGRALHLASLGGHENIVKFLVDEGVDPNSSEGVFGTALQMAATAGRERLVRLLTEDQDNQDRDPARFGSAFQAAAATGNQNVARLLLEKGADPTVCEPAFSTRAAQLLQTASSSEFRRHEKVSALELAAERGHEAIVHMIVEWYVANGNLHVLQVKSHENPAFRALQKASEAGHVEIVQFLLENGIPVGLDWYRDPLELACENGHEVIVRMILEKYSPPYIPRDDSLLEAINRNHENIIRIFFEKNILPKSLKKHFLSAARLGNVSLVRKILFIETHDQSRETECEAIKLASTGGHCEVVEILLKSLEADSMIIDSERQGDLFLNYSLCAAASKGYEDIIKVLISHGVPINCRGEDQETALIVASLNGHLNIVNFLLENGADPNSVVNSRMQIGTALQAAAFNGHTRIVQILLDSSADVNGKGGVYGTAVQAAAFSGHEEVVRLLIQQGANIKEQGGKPEAGSALPSLKRRNSDLLARLSSTVPRQFSSEKSQNGKFGTALQAAAVNGNAQIIRLLLENGADAGDVDIHGQTPLHRAAYHGHEEAVSVLLEYGTSIDTKDVKGRTAVSWAVSWGYEKLFGVLSNSGASVDGEDSSGTSPMHHAALNGHLNIMKSLLRNGARLECTDDRGYAPLFSAVKSGRVSSVNFLLSQGASVERWNSRGMTVLHEAIIRRHHSMIKPLLAAGVDVNVQSLTWPQRFDRFDPQEDKGVPAGSTPLHLSAVSDSHEISYILLLNGAHVDARDSSQKTPLYIALENGSLKVMSLLLKWGANLHADSSEGNLLHLAVKRDNCDFVRKLLDNGARVDAREESTDKTALHLAAKRGFLQIVALLLEKEATVDAQDRRLQTPLHLAAMSKHEAVIELLLKHGADLNARDESQATPLHCAARSGRASAIAILAEQGALCDVGDKDQRTPLHLAVGATRRDAVKMLLEKGADVLIGDKYGDTPLHHCAQIVTFQARGRPLNDIAYIINLLLGYGSNLQATNKALKTPLEVANEFQRTKIEEFFHNNPSYEASELVHDRNRDIFL